jgi:hypothetical protein
MKKKIVLIISCISFWFFAGCAVSPIPENIAWLQGHARNDWMATKDIIHKGDIIFRLGNRKVLMDTVDFSQMVADISGGDFSHVAIVIQDYDFVSQKGSVMNGVAIMNVSVHGVERKFFRDWHISGTKNLVIKRLKPKYRFLIPIIMETAREVIENDSLYNQRFIYSDDIFYCSQLVDYIFRKNDWPLADLISIKDLPNYNLAYRIACFVANVSPDTRIAIAGNEDHGIFSSHMLETVIDLRGK